MSLVDPETIQDGIRQLLLFDPEIEHSRANFAFEMAMVGGVGVVPDFIAFNVERQGNAGLNEEVQHIVDGRLGQTVDFVNEIAVDHINSGMVTLGNQVTHYFHPLLQRPYSMFQKVS